MKIIEVITLKKYGLIHNFLSFVLVSLALYFLIVGERKIYLPLFLINIIHMLVFIVLSIIANKPRLTLFDVLARRTTPPRERTLTEVFTSYLVVLSCLGVLLSLPALIIHIWVRSYPTVFWSQLSSIRVWMCCSSTSGACRGSQCP